MENSAQPVSIPRAGMFATVRNRRGVISAVEPFDGDKGRLHLVHLEYKDDQLPHEDRLLWELEPHKNLLEPTALPRVAGTDPMPADDFDALLRASRWVAATPYLSLEQWNALSRLPISSPFHGAVQVGGLSACAPSKGTAHAAGQPAYSGRCRPRQNDRSRVDLERTPASTSYPAGADPYPGLPASSVAR